MNIFVISTIDVDFYFLTPKKGAQQRKIQYCIPNEFFSRDMKVTLTTWFNTQPRWDGGSREWKRYLPYDKVAYSEVFKMNMDVCSSQQDAACKNQSDSIRGRKIYFPTKNKCNFAPENLYASGKIAEIRKYESKSGPEWKVIITTTGIAN